MDMLGGAAAEATISIKAKEGSYFVLSMTGYEHLGQMYEYTVELAQVPEESLNPMAKPKTPQLSKLIGTAATVSLNIKDKDDQRHFYGYVTRAKRGEKRGRYTIYTITLRPGIWFMTQSKDSKVFQDKTVKDVISEIFQEYSIDAKWDLKETYPKLDYCVQYNETDFDFVHRLLEEAGIYYHFEHKKDAHKMVLKDTLASHEAYPTNAKITWRMAMSQEPTVVAWYMQEEVRSAETVLTEYDFLDPAVLVEGKAKAKEPPAMLGKMDWFEHPARTVQNVVKPEKQPDEKTPAGQRATVRQEELQSCYASATATTNVRGLSLGMTFDVEVEPNKDDNGTYVMVSAIYRIDFGGVESIAELKSTGKHEGYLCDFLCVSKKGVNYRTPRVTPRPVIAGPQTAVVVGSSGNEIETDKHGRVKVQFFWDRLGKKDQNSSCWVRVAQPWAGKGYGMFSLPRVGDEVVVHFLNGDPDRPLVIGAVYNNVNMMAWKLPEQATVTGFKSRSSKKGDEKGKEANELRFDDLKGKEYIWFHAERDFHRQVEHDAFDWVGNNESVKVTLTRKEVIGENWYLDVTKDVMHNLGKDLHVNVAGDIFYTGGATFQLLLTKDFTAKVEGDFGAEVVGKTQLKSTGDISIESSGKITLKGASIVLDASSAVTLMVGGSLVNVASAGVDIVGGMVKVNSGGSGGSGSPASPAKPDKAKKEDSVTPAKKTDYDKTFVDPMPITDGGTGDNNAKAS